MAFLVLLSASVSTGADHNLVLVNERRLSGLLENPAPWQAPTLTWLADRIGGPR